MKGLHLKRLWNYADPWQAKIILASVYSFANKFFDVFPEILIGVAIDVVVQKDQSFIASFGFETPAQQLGILAGLTFLIWASESITEYAALVRWRSLAQEVQHALRMDGIKHSQSLDLKWYEDKNTGQLLSVLGEDVNQVERFLNEGLHNILQLLVSSLLIGAVFFYISPAIAILALIPIPIILIGGMKFRKHLEGCYASVRESAGHLAAALSGMMTGVVTIRAATAEDHLIAHVERLSHQYNANNRQAIRLSTAFVPIIRVAVLSGFLFTLVLGGLKTFDGDISPAAYTVLVFLTQRLLWPFTRFGEIIDLYERSMASATRVLDLLETPIGIKDPSHPRPFQGAHGQRARGDISFNKVSFSYGQNIPVLEDFSLDIPAGKFIALVGATGSGKSTITKLLLRFYDPEQGHISIDGIPIQELCLKDLRRNIGYVSQDVFLLDGTIQENISLQVPAASLESVCEVATIAEADEFIRKIPEAYQASVGERGQKLSGGQRQRLAIARSLLGSPSILVLDEATSAVDNETEASIQRSIERFKDSAASHQPHTIIVIAHRLSTIRNADAIYVIDHGKIIEQGRHNDLVQAKGLYSKLWGIQTGERQSL